MEKKWRIVLIGPPLCGKSTQAKLISRELAVPNISIGELLRREIAKNSKLGLKVREIVYSGKLVSDEIVIDIVQNFLEDPESKDGYILDGFPRTIKQAKFLDKYLKLTGNHLDFMIVLEITKEEILKRAVKRRENKKREDDDLDKSLVNRLASYEEHAIPTIKFFETQGIVHYIDGASTIEQVFNDILKIFNSERT